MNYIEKEDNIYLVCQAQDYFGMSLLHRLKPEWFTGSTLLGWSGTISAFETTLNTGSYMEGLIDKPLINDHGLK